MTLGKYPGPLYIVKASMTVLIIIITMSLGCSSGGGYQRQDLMSGPPEPMVHETEDGVIVSVIPSYWPGEPQNLDSYVTPFYIEITNYTGKTINVGFDDFVLFDDLKTQYRPLAPKVVASIFNSTTQTVEQRGYSSYPRLSVGIGFGTGGYYGRGYRGYGRYGYARPYYNRIGVYGYYPINYPSYTTYTKQVDTSDIIIEGLAPGNIFPDATVKGFVYFKRLPDEAMNVTLDVGYSDTQTKERHVLSFPFSVEFRNY